MKRTDVRLGCAARRGVLQIGVYYKKKCTYLIYTTVMFKIICNIDSCYDQFDFINPNPTLAATCFLLSITSCAIMVNRISLMA